MTTNLETLHKACMCNRSEITDETECGCFFCLRTFKGAEINEWIHDKCGDTAVCPNCRIDSLLPNVTDMDILEAMNIKWFMTLSEED